MVDKIISGGQTGVDRAALEAAVECGIPTGGYAPQGYLTENGMDKTLKQFNLIDSGSGYPVRTALNVLHSDITIWFGDSDTAGFKATQKKAARYEKPFVVVTYMDSNTIAEVIRKHHVVNIAGNRESKSPGIFELTKKRLIEVFKLVN